MNTNIDKKIIISIIAVAMVIALGIGFWFWNKTKIQKVPALPTQATEQTNGNSAKSINQELDNLDIGNIDKEFQDIDKNINSL